MRVVSLRSRREVLRLAGGVAASAFLGVRGAAGAKRPAARKVSLYAVHTGERLSITYFKRGAYQPDAMAALRRLLRDHHTDETHDMDPTLLDQLHRLGAALGSREPFHVVCGYRSPETNARERAQHDGVASHSLHVDGRAVDLFVPDRSLEDVRTAALRLAAGGVGYYPASGFVHVDTGHVRTW
jgi:uncharacterized protein YcbK (DUF882 family)